MLKSIEDISSTKKRFTIEIPSDVIEREIVNSLERLRYSVRIPGFRPGKAPMGLIEKRFGKDVEAEVLEKLITEYYKMAIRESGFKPVSMPELETEVDFKRNNPLNLTFTLEVLPKIEQLNYEDISVKDISVDVKDSDIESVLERLQQQRATYEVADKPIEMDDLVDFEFVDCEIVNGENEPVYKEIISKLGNEIFDPDFMEGLIGKKKEDIVEFVKRFDEHYERKEIAGKTFNIKLRIQEVKKKVLPQIDDEFAKDLGFDDLNALKERLKVNILKAKQQEVKRLQKAEIVNKLIEKNPLDVPESLLEKEFQSYIAEGRLSSDVFDEEIEISEDDKSAEVKDSDSLDDKQRQVERLERKIKEKVAKSLKASILINYIGEKEGVIVSDDDVRQGLEGMAKRLDTTPERLMNLYSQKDDLMESLRHSIYEDKVLDLLLSKSIKEKEVNE